MAENGDCKMTYKFECVVSADLFRRVRIGTSKEQTRYYLNGVHVSASPEGGALLCATDGHILVAMVDPDAIVEGEGIVQLDAQLARLLPVNKGPLLDERLLFVSQYSGKSRSYIIDAPRFTAAANSDEYRSPYVVAQEIAADPDARVKGAHFGPSTIDGVFPDWRRVIPSNLTPDAAVPTFDQTLLVRAAQALMPFGQTASVRLTPSADNGPIFVSSDLSESPEGFAIIMPTRPTGRVAAVPAWASRPNLAEAA